jgi:hypothetical protein
MLEPLEGRTLFTLLGIDLSHTFPDIQSASPGTIQYQPGTATQPGTFSAISTNLNLVQQDPSTPGATLNDPITPATSSGSSAASIQILIKDDGSGAGILAGGNGPSVGQDIVVQGHVVVVNPDGTTSTYDGTLLTGTIEAFGDEFDNAFFPGLPNDGSFDFRFKPTGGLMESNYFTGQDIGVSLRGTSANPFPADPYADGFTLTEPKADIGPVAPLNQPHVTTIVTTPQPTNVLLGPGPVTLTDTAVLSGGASPTGNITFTLVAPGGGTVDTETVAVSGNGSYTTPAGYVLPTGSTIVGTYQWNATYTSADGNNLSASDNNDPAERVAVSPASPTIATTPSTTAVTLGTSAINLKDTADLELGYNPTGTITFTLVSQGGTTVDTETVAVNGNGLYTTPTGYTLPTAGAVSGTYQWNAAYSGDTNNNAKSETNDSTERVVVSPATPALVTTPSQASITLTDAVPPVLNDTAVLSGGYNETGIITFTLIGPGGGTVDTETVSVNGNGSYTTPVGYSLPATGPVAGTYQWTASYSGDANNGSVNESNPGGETVVVSPATPSIVTTPSPSAVNLATGTVTLKDTAILSGGYNPAGMITFTLVAPGGATVDTETISVSGDGSYTTPTGYTLPTATNVTGTYQWNAVYTSGNGNNVNASDINDAAERVTVSPATPSIVTTPTPATVNLATGTVTLKDTAVLAGGYGPTGTITFTLVAPGGATVDTETVAVSGNGSYATPVGYVLPTSGTVAGTYQWNATYTDASGNNSNASDINNAAEQVMVSPATPGISTTPAVVTSTGAGGQYATIGFWHNKNGQAVIINFSGSVGSALASNYPNLFGASNPYTGTSLAGLTNAQVANVYESLWTPSGLQKNTYVQAFAVALGGYSSNGAGVFNVGSNGAAFGVANNTTLPITQILQVANANFSPATGLFYGGDSTNTSALNTVLNNINQAGEQPGGIPVVSVGKINDTAVLSGTYNPNGTITFYLFAPGVTPNGSYSNNVYSDVVTVTGNGPYSTATQGTNPGGYVTTATGTYQWVAVYSGDGNNNTVTSPFGAEPVTVGKQSPTVLTTTPNMTAVTLSSSTSPIVLKDTADLEMGVSPTGTLTWALVAPNGTTVDTETVTINGNGTYSTPTGYTLPTSGNVTGTYQWNATYSGDANNIGDTFLNDPSERTVVSAAGPSITTTPGGTITLGSCGSSTSKLSDSATISGGYNPTGTVTFYLFAPGVTPNGAYSNSIYSDVVSVSGNGTYTTAAGTNPGGYLPTVAGTYEWVAVYSGSANNASVTSPFGSEPEAVGASTPVAAGQFATIGFWHNKNGQALINSFNGGSSSTQLGNWLATNFPHLFGAPNPYDSATLASDNATSLAGLTNAQVAKVYQNLWNPSGVTKNSYVQAFAVALGLYADTSTLGGQAGAAYGFKVTATGAGTFNVGSNGAAFGVPNNTSVPVVQILQILDSKFSPSTGLFYGGNQTLTSQANNVLNGINTTGDISLVAADASSTGADAPLVTTLAPMSQGTLVVAVDTGSFAADPNAAAEQAGIDAAIASINQTLASRGVTLQEIQGDDSVIADVHLHLSATSDIGGASNGVLGVTEMAGQEVTIITGWNYYFGSDPTGIAAGQYDFQSVVSHELGHSIGLGHSTDSTSVMYPYLDTQQIHRTLTAADLAFLDSDGGAAPEPLLAANRPAPVQAGPMVPASVVHRLNHNAHASMQGLAAAASHSLLTNVPESSAQGASNGSLFSTLPVNDIAGTDSVIQRLLGRRHGRK